LTFNDGSATPSSSTGSSVITKISSVVAAAKPIVSTARSLVPTQTTAPTIKTNETQTYPSPYQAGQPVLSTGSASGGAMLVPGSGETSNDAIQAQDSSKKTGFLQKTTSWVKENPGKS